MKLPAWKGRPEAERLCVCKEPLKLRRYVGFFLCGLCGYLIAKGGADASSSGQ